MEDIDNGTTNNTDNGTDNGTTPKSLPTGDSSNKSLDVGESTNKEIEEGKDPHKTLPTRDHETKKINESSHESEANDKAYEEPKEEVKADLFNLDYFDKPEEAPKEVTEKASELINGDLNYFDNWIEEAEDRKKQNKEQLDAYLKSNVESGNQLAYNSEDFIEDKINNINPFSGPLAGFREFMADSINDQFNDLKNSAKGGFLNIENEVARNGRVSDRSINSLNTTIEAIDRKLRNIGLGEQEYKEPLEKLKREVEFAKEKANDINTNGVTKNTGISAESERQQINDALAPAKERLMSAYESGDPTAIENAKQNYERVANRVKQEFGGSEVSRRAWNVLNKPEVFYQKMEEEYGPTPETPTTRTEETPTSTSVPTRTEPVPETPTRTSEPETPETPTTEPETPTEEATESEESTEVESAEEPTPETPTSTDDAIAKADEAKAAYEEAKKREYEAIHREADETEIAQLAAEVERLRQEWEEAEAEAAALRPREDGSETEGEPKEPRIGHGREDRELSKEETLPEWVGGDDPHTSSAGAYWAGAFGDENWSDKVPQKTAQGLIDYANDHHDNPFAMFGMTALMGAGGYDFLKAGKDVQEIIASAKDVTANVSNAMDFFKNGSVLDGIKSILSAGWSVLKIFGNTVSAAWNVCKSTFSFLRSVFAPISSAVSSLLNTVNGYNSVKSMIRDMFGVENTDEVIAEVFGDESETATEQKPVNVLNKTGFSVKGGTVTDESDYNKGLKEKENEIASDVCKKTMLYFPYLRKAIK